MSELFDLIAALAEASAWNHKRQQRIEELESDLAEERERLDWMIKTGWRMVSTSPNGDWRMKDIHGDFRTGWYDDPRSAIDAGRKVQP